MIPNFTFTMGYVFDSLLSYLLPDWRDFTLALSILTFPFILFWPLWPKSPRWLFSVGRAKEGQEVVKLFAKDCVDLYSGPFEYADGPILKLKLNLKIFDPITENENRFIKIREWQCWSRSG